MKKLDFDYLALSIAGLELAPRIYTCLSRENIYTLQDLIIAIGNPDNLLQITGLGKEDLEKIHVKLDHFYQNYFVVRRKLRFRFLKYKQNAL